MARVYRYEKVLRFYRLQYSYSEIADSMVETDNGMIFGAEHAPEEWMDGYAWAMILDENGNVKEL